jgi:beta-lactam-binding protein with PASTA domain
MPKVEAERLLTAAELRIGAIHDFHDWKVPAGAIMETDPRRGTRVAPGSSITLFISKGKP